MSGRDRGRADFLNFRHCDRVYMEAFLSCLPGEKKERALITHVSLLLASYNLKSKLIATRLRLRSTSLVSSESSLSLFTLDRELIRVSRFRSDGFTTAFVSRRDLRLGAKSR